MTLAWGEWVYWLLTVGFLLANGVFVYAAWWCLFADRPKGRRRCPRCWYDLTYSPGMTCAECGFTARHENVLLKTRRRYGWATVAICVCVVVNLGVNEQITKTGWSSIIPFRALLWSAPFVDGSNNMVIRELDFRARNRKLSDGQWHALVNRCARGDWWARPPDDDWISKYGSFITSRRRLFDSDSELAAMLLGIPPRLDATTRDAWPKNVPVSVDLMLTDFWPWGMECRVRATPRLPDAPTTTFFRTGDDRYQQTPYVLYLPTLDEPKEDVLIDFEIDRRPMLIADSSESDETDAHESPQEWEHVSQQSVRVPIVIEGPLETVQKPVDDSVMTQAIRDTFRHGVVKWPVGMSPVRVSIDIRQTEIPEFNDTSVGVSIELFRDEDLARRLNAWWLGGVGIRRDQRDYGFEVHYENQNLLRTANANDQRWTMRVRSNPQVALRVKNAKTQWKGDFTVPLIVTERPEPAPPRPWWTETIE